LASARCRLIAQHDFHKGFLPVIILTNTSTMAITKRT
jgi:hypothetical protein